MRAPDTNRDHGDEQPTLFPEPTRCTARGCQAGDRKNLCTFDADIAAGIRDPYARRPKGCINHAWLAPDEPLPF